MYKCIVLTFQHWMMPSIYGKCLFVFAAKPDLGLLAKWGPYWFFSEFLPEVQPIRAGLSFSHSFWAWANQRACFRWEHPSWRLTSSVGFVGSRSGRMMLLSPVL